MIIRDYRRLIIFKTIGRRGEYLLLFLGWNVWHHAIGIKFTFMHMTFALCPIGGCSGIDLHPSKVKNSMIFSQKTVPFSKLISDGVHFLHHRMVEVFVRKKGRSEDHDQAGDEHESHEAAIDDVVHAIATPLLPPSTTGVESVLIIVTVVDAVDEIVS